jgi:hypothetical protein
MIPRILWVVMFLASAPLTQLNAETYVPVSAKGNFLRGFEKAYRSGDKEWIRSAVDKDGIVEEARSIYFGLLGPNDSAGAITNLRVMAAPEGYVMPNSLLDFQVAPTIPVDFLLVFERQETTIRVPAGYRDGKIWLVGIKKK